MWGKTQSPISLIVTGPGSDVNQGRLKLFLINLAALPRTPWSFLGLLPPDGVVCAGFTLLA